MTDNGMQEEPVIVPDVNPGRLPLGTLALRSLLAGALAGTALAGFASLAGAQSIAGFNSSQPVNYAADRIELQDRQNRVVLSGNVVIEQGDLRLTAPRASVAYTDEGSLRIQRIDITGGVNVARGKERASGEVAIYDLTRRIIIMSGNVALRSDSDTLNGGRIVIDLKTGLSNVEGNPASGRVTGSFSVPN